jgi:hypothetical protein
VSLFWRRLVSAAFCARCSSLDSAGRGKQSHAYIHSVQQDHHVFINLETGKVCTGNKCSSCIPISLFLSLFLLMKQRALTFHLKIVCLFSSQIYCLPDGYEVIDASLEDIQVRRFNQLFLFVLIASGLVSMFKWTRISSIQS